MPAKTRLIPALLLSAMLLPFSLRADYEAPFYYTVSMPQSRPMPDIGAGCHELRVTDAGGEWRLVYAVTPEAVVVLDVFKKTTRTTPQTILTRCARRLRDYHRRDSK